MNEEPTSKNEDDKGGIKKMNKIKKESKYIFNKESPGYKVSLLLIYPIYFLAGTGVFFYIMIILNIWWTWWSDSPIDFNACLKGWSIIWFILGGGFFSMFVWLIHEYIEEFAKGQANYKKKPGK